MNQFVTSLGVAMVSAFVAFLVSWGWNKRAMQDFEKQIDNHSEQHRDHYKHAADTDAHWTPRERNALTSQLKSIDDNVVELLKRSGGPRP